MFSHFIQRFVCIVVITSALHAEGRGFDPRMEYNFFKFYFILQNGISHFCDTVRAWTKTFWIDIALLFCCS